MRAITVYDMECSRCTYLYCLIVFFWFSTVGSSVKDVGFPVLDMEEASYQIKAHVRIRTKAVQ